MSAAVLGTNGSAQLIPAGANALESLIYCEDTSGSATAQSCTTTPSFTPAAGECVIYSTTTANTGNLTLNVNALGAKNVRKWMGASVLAAGDMPANQQVLTCYDGTDWEVSTIGNAPGGLASQGIPPAGIVTSTGAAISSASTVMGGQFPALPGDLTTPGGSLATTLATVNSSPGSCGSASVVCAITTNGKGLVTAQTATTIAIPYSQVSGTPTLAQTIAAVSHEWLNSYSATTGAFAQTQPTLADIAAGATGSGTYDFSGATQVKLPVAAGYVSAANGELGYDSTNLNWHGWANGADEFFAGFSVSSPPTSGHLAEFSKSSNSWSLIDGGAIGPLASGGYPASGIVNSTGSAWGTSYGTSGTGTTVALTAAPTFTGTTTLATAAVTTFSGTPNFSGAATGQTASTSDNSTKLATTAYVQSQSYSSTVATVDLTGQNASISKTTITTPASNGFYTIHVYVNESGLCTELSGNVVITLYWTDTGTAQSVNGTVEFHTTTAAEVGAEFTSAIPVYVVGGNAIAYSTSLTACPAGPEAYDVHIRVSTN